MKKRKLYKKLVILIAAVVLCAGVLSGCMPTRRGTVIDDLKYDENGNPIFSDVNLTVWSIIGEPDNVYLDKVNRMFNDYYREDGIQAKVVSLANADFYTQLANVINTDIERAPDVVIFHSERLTKLAKDDIIVPVDQYLELGKANFSKDDYLPNVMNECYYDGKLYGVPLDVHAGMWYVRSDILEKNGLETPTTLTEFISVCNELIKKYERGELWHRALDKDPANCGWTTAKTFGANYNPVVMSDTGGIENGWIPQTAVLQNGGALVDDKGMPAWKTDELTKVLQMFRNWQTGEGYNGAFVGPDQSSDTVWANLAKGSAVFSCEAPWWIERRLNEYEELLGGLKDEQGKTYAPLDVLNFSKMFALDENSADASKIYGVGHCFSISKSVSSTTRRTAAALYAQYMTENAVDYMQGGHLPASKKILDSKQYTEKPFYKRYLNKFGEPENFVMLGNTPYYDAVYGKLKSTYIDVFTKSKNNVSVEQLIATRYSEALKEISSIQDL